KPYFTRFVEKLPDIRALAVVEEEVLLKLWEGLGYYNRARNLQKAAKIIVEQYDGQMPPDYEKLLALPGIGSYTAGAIASIAYGIPVPAVDGNVLRVLSRIMADDSDILKQSVKKKAERLLLANMPEDKSAEFNQAMMEIGAMVCLPNGEPKCRECPLIPFCLAHAQESELSYPVKKAKKERRIEERTILILHDAKERIAIEKRSDKGLLAGLYEFPNLEGRLSKEEVLACMEQWGYHVGSLEKLEPAKHIFSHVEWHMTGYELWIDVQGNKPELLFVELSQMREEYPLPNAFAAYKKWLGIMTEVKENREKNKGDESI
ncbi:MAG: A/G-specific adenine glycosylase, partial [Lachnospiraceae bacterium]|nr:A/G-specific adenine glycosylase [Lachnospiraceae bacterium]